MAQQGDRSEPRSSRRRPQQECSSTGQSNPIVEHSGVELPPADGPTGDLGADGGQEPDDAAAAVNTAVKEAAEGKAASWFEWSPGDLVDTPGAINTILSLWVFFLQKLSLQWYVGVDWPSWFLNFLGALGFLCFEVPAFGIGLEWLMIPEECVFAARLLLSVALLARMACVMYTSDHNKEPPRYSSASEIVRTVARGVAAPTLLSALAIAIGAPTGTIWLTGLGVVLCWPVIGYLILAHVARVQIWKSCRSKCVGLSEHVREQLK